MNKTGVAHTRRTFLGSLAAFFGLEAINNFSLIAATASLRSYAAEKGILFGTASSVVALQDLAYASLVIGQSAVTVPENALKWAALRPSPDSFNFKDGDTLCNFAQAHAMAYRGHALVWHGAMPRWFSSVANKENAEQILIKHISTVVAHYADKMHSWDVVNEAVEIADGRPDGLRNTSWLQLLGPAYIETAFRQAHGIDPKAVLVYNENFLEADDEQSERKRQAVLALLTGLKRNQVPVHALGIQSHLYGEDNTTSPRFGRFLDCIADLGLSIFITELDVRDKHLPAAVGVRDQMIADQYFNYLAFILQRRAVKVVITWGLTDRYTWITDYHPRPDAAPVRPLLYDANLQPKQAYDAVARAFKEAAVR